MPLTAVAQGSHIRGELKGGEAKMLWLIVMVIGIILVGIILALGAFGLFLWFVDLLNPWSDRNLEQQARLRGLGPLSDEARMAQEEMSELGIGRKPES